MTLMFMVSLMRADRETSATSAARFHRSLSLSVARIRICLSAGPSSSLTLVDTVRSMSSAT